MVGKPGQSGFIMPAEWEKHSAVWLAWPYDETTFPKRIPQAEKVFIRMIKAIYESETVKLLVVDLKMKEQVASLIKKAGGDVRKVDFIITDFAFVWTRDYGRLFIVKRREKKLAWVKWIYNAYGKGDNPYFSPVVRDNDVFNNIDLSAEKFAADIVLEGGAIDVNGEGMCLTTEETLMNPNRNPEKSKSEMQKYLSDYLGVRKTIWLPKGLVNDHTDGHIDEVARFAGSNKILCAYEDDPSDENFKILDDNYRILKNSVDQNGKPFEIIKLPMPHMRHEDGSKAPVSYCNFYIGNTTVLMASFGDPNDEKARKIIAECFPDRQVAVIDCREIISGGGGIHCMTQQQPAV